MTHAILAWIVFFTLAQSLKIISDLNSITYAIGVINNTHNQW
jgi:hypothetical protein